MSSNKLGIIAAGKIEVRDILDNRLFQWTEIEKKLFCSPKGLYLVISGLGQKNALESLNKIINKVSAVLVMGTAGGLNATKVHDLFLITSSAFTALRSTCIKLGLDLKTGKLISVDAPVTNPNGLAADLVDMESVPVLESCQSKNIPVASLRYITDRADQHVLKDWKNNVSKASQLFNKIIELFVSEFK